MPVCISIEEKIRQMRMEKKKDVVVMVSQKKRGNGPTLEVCTLNCMNEHDNNEKMSQSINQR